MKHREKGEKEKIRHGNLFLFNSGFKREKFEIMILRG